MNRDIYLALRDLVTVHSQSPALDIRNTPLELIVALAGLGGNIAHSAQGRRSPRKVSDRVCFDWRLTLVQPGHYGRRRNILESLLPSPQRDRIEHANWFPAAGVVASRTQLRRVPAFTKEAIRAYAAANIVPGCWAFSDGLTCFTGLAEAGLRHVPVVTGSGRPRMPLFKWVNTGLGNVKSAITSTCRSLGLPHIDRYLAAYEWRFNRRFDLQANLVRLARVAAQTAPKTYRSLTAFPAPAEMTG